MAKGKQNDGQPVAGNVPNRDLLHRLNYLHQASRYLAQVAPPPAFKSFPKFRKVKISQPRENPVAAPARPACGCPVPHYIAPPTPVSHSVEIVDKKSPIANESATPQKKKEELKFDVNNARADVTGRLSRHLSGSVRTIGKKATLRLDATIKREICKTCNTVLIPGVTSTVRVKRSSSYGQLIRHKCMACATERRIPAPPVISDKGEQLKESTLSKRAKKQLRRAHKAPAFHARDSHVIFKGKERVQMEAEK